MIPRPEMLRVYGVKINLRNGGKMYAPLVVFGQYNRLLKLSWRTNTMARQYGEKVLKRYAKLLEVGRG